MNVDIEIGKLIIEVDGKEYRIQCDVSRSACFIEDEVVLRIKRDAAPFQIADGSSYEISLATNANRCYQNVYIGRAYGGIGHRRPQQLGCPPDYVSPNWFITIPDSRQNLEVKDNRVIRYLGEWSSRHPRITPEEIKLNEMSAMLGELHASAMSMAKTIEKMREAK